MIWLSGSRLECQARLSEGDDQDARYRYHYYLSPTCVSEAELAEPSLAELARVIKAGACIEASFKRGKGEDGVRQQLGLYHVYSNVCLPHASVRHPLLQPEPTSPSDRRA